MDTELAIRINTGHQMIDLSGFMARPEFAKYRAHFEAALSTRNPPGRHGDLPAWLETLNRLPSVSPSEINLNQDMLKFGQRSDLNNDQANSLASALLALSPWRKGPYDLFGTIIDTEWRSDWKWQRVAPHISPLHERTVLDVGCGSGYHCWRMLGDGARYVLGIDPSMRFVVQNAAIQKYAQDARFDFAALGIEDMPNDLPVFDSVFSMGVLYHRRHPINHLLELKDLLQRGGEVVLETLIVDPSKDSPWLLDGVLMPESRYAQMRNVWSVMTVEKILDLLDEAGFKDPKCVNQNVTSLQEQRSTQWMQYHSLRDFLNPDDISLTIEGYPAPKRGLFIAHK